MDGVNSVNSNHNPVQPHVEEKAVEENTQPKDVEVSNSNDLQGKIVDITG